MNVIPFEGPEPGPEERAKGKKSTATQLVDLVLASGESEFFHTPDGATYAYLDMNTHRETWPLRAGPLRRWLQRRFYDETGATANAQAVQDALGTLEGRALWDGDELEVYTRMAELDGAVYLDLCDEYWRAVKVTTTGWEIVESPVRFRRSSGMLELPGPVAGGSLDELRPFVNVDAKGWILLVGWLLEAARARGPYPVAALHGEQGAAKSTTARALRELIDPNAAPLRSQPRDERDLQIAARNGWVLAYDNLSHLPDWLSDAFCRLSTGGGLATRQLYTDMDEVIFDAKRPLLLTGIEELATRGDLLDRALVLRLPTIPERSRRTEVEFWHAFEQAKPKLLGALLSAVSTALEREHRVRLEQLPRMADFAVWVTAAEPGLGWQAGTFLDAYAENRAEALELTLEASPIAEAVRDLATEREFLGRADALLELLSERVGEQVVRRKTWPKNARALSGALRRIAPNLRATGIEVEFEQRIGRGSPRGILIRKEPQTSGTSGTSGTDRMDTEVPGTAGTASTANSPTRTNAEEEAQPLFTGTEPGVEPDETPDREESDDIPW